MTHSERGFPIVGVGASAGGLNALQKLFANMPAQPGMAFVIIQHLDPTKSSFTAELLAKHTDLRITQVEDEPRVTPNCIYVIPPNKYLSLADGMLHLSEPGHPRGRRVPIDFFLRSLAENARERAVAIILSGTGADGTLGLKAIKAEGGLVIVQEPGSAEYAGMPESALGTGLVDFSLPVERIPEALVHYAQHAAVADEKSTTSPEKTSTELRAVLGLLRSHTRQDFRCYKEGTLLRRTRRRMGLHSISELAEYRDYLREHPRELDALAKDLLISVTDFFRDPPAWQALEELVIAPLLEAKAADTTLRAWVPGCATGEEPYSLAMLLLEHMSRAGKHCTVQVFASDIDKNALERARRGLYPQVIVGDVAPERLKRFFEPHSRHGYYQVSKALRESVIFAEQNLIADPPFSRLDLICCRNLLIYLRPEVQQKILGLFHFALREDGYLFLGSSETVGRETGLFQPVTRKWRIYRRVGGVRSQNVALPAASERPRAEIEKTPSSLPQRREVRLAHVAQQRLLDWLAPRAVLVDKQWQIVYFCGDTDAFLTHTPGAATQDLLAKARPGLRTKVRGVVQKALSEGETIVAEARVNRDGRFQTVRVTARPVRDPPSEEVLALVIFDEASNREGGSRQEDKQASRGAERQEASEVDGEDIIRHLEDELANTKEDLQSSIDQLETSNEEFKASNEEVMSVSEELQSTNEELETSKEELQSLNEELNTLNNQLAIKVEELEQKNNDLNNLITSTDIPTLCLDRAMRIKWFTPVTTRLMNLVVSDIDRPLTDFSHNFTGEDLLEDAREVLDRLVPSEKEVSTVDGGVYLRRVVPYRAQEERIDGVVITLVDITRRKRAEDALHRSEQRLRQLNQTLEVQVRDRTEQLSLLQRVTVAANEAESVEDGLHRALNAICETNRWLMGELYQLADDDSGDLVYSGRSVVRENAPPALRARLEDLQRRLAAQRFGPADGVLGRVLSSGQPQWAEDFDKDSKPRHGALSETGLRTVIACPVTAAGAVLAVLAFYSDEALAEEKRFLHIMPNIGIQLGHLMARKRLEKEIAEISDWEQRRLGQEIHDGLSQQISGTALLAAGLTESLRASGLPQAEKAQRLKEALEEAKRQSRALINGVMPVAVEPAGLMGALEGLTERTQTMYGLRCTFECSQPVEITDSFTATHLYRIAFEAVHNAVKYAQARQVTVCLSKADGKVLSVQDDGIGLSGTNLAGIGIRMMRYRAELIGASLTIESGDDEGTTVTCYLRN